MQTIVTNLEKMLPLSGQSFLTFLLRLVVCLIICLIARKLIRKLIHIYKNMAEMTPMETGAITFTASFIKIGSWAVIFIFLGLWLGIKESSILALLASTSVALTLSLQSLLGNLAGGIELLIFTPFQVGDFIVHEETEGTVEKIEILHTAICTIDNRRVLIPNGELISKKVTNVTAKPQRMINLTVGISYETDLKKAKEVITDLLNADSRILKDLPDRPNLVVVSGLKDSCVELNIRCWVATSNYLPVLWDLNENLKLTFDEKGLSFPYPQLDVHLKQ